jgi:hypothetical protein
MTKSVIIIDYDRSISKNCHISPGSTLNRTDFNNA